MNKKEKKFDLGLKKPPKQSMFYIMKFGWGHHLFGICDQLAFFHVVSTKRQMCFKAPDNPPKKEGCWRLMAVAGKEKEVGHGYRVLICVCFCQLQVDVVAGSLHRC